MDWNCRTPLLLFIIQQLAIITSKLIIRLSSMSAAQNSPLNPEIPLPSPALRTVPPSAWGPLVSTRVGWLQLVQARRHRLRGARTQRARICQVPSCTAGKRWDMSVRSRASPTERRIWIEDSRAVVGWALRPGSNPRTRSHLAKPSTCSPRKLS